MLATLKVITPPASSVVDFELAFLHTRIDSDAERALFAFYLEAATEQVEKYLGRSLITQTLQWTISQVQRNSPWPNGFGPQSIVPISHDWALRNISAGIIELPYSPVQGIVSVTTGEWGVADTVLQPGIDYTSDTTLDPARLRLDPAYSWGSYNHLSITYTAGYGATGASVPRSIGNAVMMLATNLYENRGDGEGGGMTRAIMNLLNPYRIVTYAA